MNQKVSTAAEYNPSAIDRLSQRINEHSETSRIHLLYELEEGDKINFYIGVDKTDPSVSSDPRVSEKRINMLCEALGMNPQRVSEYFKPDTADQADYYTERDLKRAQREGKSIGAIVTSGSVAVLPIETEDKGSGSVQLTFVSPESVEVVINSDGYFWSERSEDEEEFIGIGWSIDYKATVTPCVQAEV